MATYSWLTKTAAISALQSRLNNSSLWTAGELFLYIVESLRHWNGLTEQWNQTISIPNANGQWINTGTLAGSPRLRTVTDESLYIQMALMLLESVTGGAWTGSSQFTLQNLQWALQKRVQEVIQATSCNITQLSPINATPGIRNGYALADTVLEPRRNRSLALMAQTTATGASGASSISVGSATGIVTGQVISGAGIQTGTFAISVTGLAVGLSLPITAPLSTTAVQFFQPYLLTREDVLSFQSFEPQYPQMVGYPQSWAVASEPPLSFDVDIAPATPGYFDLLALNAAPTFAPPTPSLIGIPDDFSWVPMYGALADVLGMESESTDRARAAYCLRRYQLGLEVMVNSNWMTQCLLNQAVASSVSLFDMDSLAVNWQESNNNLPAVIEAGMDFISPVPGQSQLLSINLVGNAPLLDATGTYVQVSQDDWGAVLNMSHHIASFKMGNQMFEDTMPMFKDFLQYAANVNKRLATYGLFVEELRSQGGKQGESQPKMVS